MIQRLIDSLRVLAAAPETQLARYPSWTVRPDEIAMEFGDALLVVDSCQQETLGEEEREAIEKIDRLLDHYSGCDQGFWTEAAVRQDARWEELRRLAAEALNLLGYTSDPPGPSGKVFTRGSE